MHGASLRTRGLQYGAPLWPVFPRSMWGWHGTATVSVVAHLARQAMQRGHVHGIAGRRVFSREPSGGSDVSTTDGISVSGVPAKLNMTQISITLRMQIRVDASSHGFPMSLYARIVEESITSHYTRCLPPTALL